jgi:hypothetical protein
MVTTDQNAFLRELSGVLEHDAPLPSRARFDEVLTTGYARALALEAEHLRLQRQLGAAAQVNGGPPVPGGQLAALAEQASAAERELTHLRRLLATLRRRRP